MPDPRIVRAALQRDLEPLWLELSAEHQREARAIAGNPPDLTRIPAHQWEAWRREEEAALFLLFYVGFATRSRSLGMPDDQLDATARAYAAPAAFWRSQQFGQSRIQSASQPTADPATKLDTLFGRRRVESILDTEVTAATTAGAEHTIGMLGLKSALDTWRTNPHKSATGPCQICDNLDGTGRDHWEIKFPNGPPAHPRCVCDLTYENVPEG